MSESCEIANGKQAEANAIDPRNLLLYMLKVFI